MGKIRMLSDEVASQVAAGEVVERPASVVKELVENGFDAGSRRITVEFARGGSRLIRVTDDGCGMDREDALLCLERHATSKIRSADDLSRVATMGFRGEAVPSIASVSRFRLVTRLHDAAAGTEISVHGGKIDHVSESGAPGGTSIEVAELFYNVPARRKFLRGEETESAHIAHQMQSLALAHPEVAMTLVRDGRKLWQAAGTGNLGVRVRDLLGPDYFSRLAEIDASEEHGIRISGFLARPGEGRPDRDQQFVILNGRVIQCPAVYQSLREAFAEALPRGRHPLAVLCIGMDPLEFDCNVHPAKREIRLHRPDQLRQAVFLAARKFLETRFSGSASAPTPAPPRTAATPAPSPPAAASTPPPCHVPAHLPTPARTSSPTPPPATAFAPQAQAELPTPTPEKGGTEDRPSHDFRIVGGLGAFWILMESAEGLVILDARAASERILFETLRREAASGHAAVQHLLFPEALELPPKDAAWISGNLEALRTAGFFLEPFGGATFKLEALPACLAARNPREALMDVCGFLRATGSIPPGTPAVEALVRSVSRLAALDRFVFEESRARRLVNELLRCELPYACPQGRPTMIQWSYFELERKFGRG